MGNFDLSNYIPVSERLALFYKDFPEGRVVTELVEHNPETGFVMFKAFAYRKPDDASPSSTGHAFEDRAAGYVNKTSYIENCETSSVGRALALLGYEIQKGIASREEMEKVQRYEKGNQKPPIIPPVPSNAPLKKRIADAKKAIEKLGGEHFPQEDGETDQDYFNSLTVEFKRLKMEKAGAEPK